jgi:integrase
LQQKLVQKPLKNIKLFEQSIRSEYTKRVYLACLNKYLQFPGQKSSSVANSNPRKIEEHIISFVIALKKQGKGFSAIHNYVSAICKYYKMNDVFLNTNKINQYLPEFRKSKKDRAYTHSEIQKLLDIADERFRAIILLLASTGMRIGAIPDLRLKNIEKISNSDFEIYKITVYEGFNEEYITFTTPECTRAIDCYLTMRSRYGEKLDASSWLIREQFDVRDPFAISRCKKVKGNTITRKLIDLAERSLLRKKEVLIGNKIRSEIRKDVPIAHGFRKFFTSQLVEADLKTELRWLLEGHNLKGNDSHYVRTTDKSLQQEYEKALDNLTIDPANRLQRKVEKLEIEKTKWLEVAEDVAKLKKKWRLKN